MVDHLLTLLEEPKSYSPSMDHQGVLNFRHPWVARNKAGINVRCSFARLNPVERGAVLMDAQQLLQRAPSQPKDAPPGTHPRLLEAYFRPLKKAQRIQRFAFEIQEDGTADVEGVRLTAGQMIGDVLTVGKYATEFRKLKSQLKHLAAHAAELEARNERNERIIAEKERLLNEHVTATLAEAFEAFKRDYHPPDAQTRNQALTTIQKFIHGGNARGGKVRGLGPGRKLAEIVPRDIDRWLDDYPPVSRVRVIHLRAELSIFFSTCKRLFDMSYMPFDKDKLKKRGDLMADAKKRAPLAVKRIEDLKMMLDALGGNLYWQSWVAFACLAGPRWEEQACLRCADLDLDARPPRAVFQARGAHRLKTRGNAVPIERRILLPILRQFAATWEPERIFVWPSQVKERQRKNLRTPLGAWSYTSFTRPCVKVLQAAAAASREPGHELWEFGPAQWRHTFGSLLALSGYNATEISSMMRNSREVASTYYINFSPLDERLRGQLVWHEHRSPQDYFEAPPSPPAKSAS